MILKGLGVFYKFAPHNYLTTEYTDRSTLDYVALSQVAGRRRRAKTPQCKNLSQSCTAQFARIV